MDRYLDRLVIAVIAVVILAAVLRQCLVAPASEEDAVDPKESASPQASRAVSYESTSPLSEEERTYRYILHVIRYGSSQLHFPGGVMEGGYLQGIEARKAACYVMGLAGKSCPDPEAREGGAMYYTSVCGGCHGNDGKGLHGNYPDLTRSPLLGLQKRVK